jgi:EmrB/QacA subfamily drug resistance transporter
MTRTQKLTLAVVSLATAMLMLDIAVVNTALSDIAADLNTGLSGLQWVVDAYTLALASVVLSAGFLADRLGRRRLFYVGLGIFTATSVVAGLAPDIHVLNAARAVQGIGAAIMFAVSLALLANAFPGTKERAGALAVYGATIGASFAVGPLVGGALTSGLDWRWVFLINLPIGLLTIAMTRAGVEESKDPNPRKIDWPGQATLAGGLFLLVLALLRGNEQGWTSTPIVAELAGAGVLLLAFLVIQARVREPMLPLKLFRNPDFTGAQVSAFAISASLFAVFLYVTLYLQQILGLSPVEAGLVYIPGTMVNLVVAGMTAGLLEKVSPRVLIGAGLALVAAGLGIMAVTVQPDSHWAVLLPGFIVAMIGTGMFNPAVSNVALSSAPAEQSGLAAGVNDTFRQAGIAVGVAALGALVPAEAALGGGSAQAYVDGLSDALYAGAALSLAGAVVAAALLGRRARNAERAADGALVPEPAAA